MEKVSVIMPCYNDGQYIEESIASVLGQTYSEIELIIIDDGSTDSATRQLLDSHTWAKTKLIHSDHIGPAAARNLGIKEATGTYILPLDADDRIHPTYIEKAVGAIQEDERRGIIYCEAELFGTQKGKWDLPSYTLANMLVDNVIFVTALFRKSDWEAVGGFDEAMKEGMEDYDFWLSLIELGREVYQLPEILFYYRKKPESRSSLFQKDEKTVITTYHHIYDNHPKLYGAQGEVYAKAMREEWVRQLLFRRKLQRSLRIFEKITYHPMIKKWLKKVLSH